MSRRVSIFVSFHAPVDVRIVQAAIASIIRDLLLQGFGCDVPPRALVDPVGRGRTPSHASMTRGGCLSGARVCVACPPRLLYQGVADERCPTARPLYGRASRRPAAGGARRGGGTVGRQQGCGGSRGVSHR